MTSDFELLEQYTDKQFLSLVGKFLIKQTHQFAYTGDDVSKMFSNLEYQDKVEKLEEEMKVMFKDNLEYFMAIMQHPEIDNFRKSLKETRTITVQKKMSKEYFGREVCIDDILNASKR